MVVLFCKDRDLKKNELASIRYVMVGAAPLAPEVIKQFIKLLSPSAVVGQGEFGGILNRPLELILRKGMG